MRRFKKQIVLASAFLIFAVILSTPLPEPLTAGDEEVALTARGKAAVAVLAFAVVVWVSQALPFSITGLLAIVLLVITKASTFETLVRDGFGNPIILFFTGVLVISAAINETPILRRITTGILFRIGHSPKLVVLAFLAVGALLSGWITDMAVAAMLLPIGVTVLSKAGARPGSSNFGRALMISCAWGPLIGGIATPAGCGPNPLTIGFLRNLAEIDFTFLDWMSIGYPAALLMIPGAWFILIRIFPFENIDLAIGEDEYRRMAEEMGPFAREEICALLIFLLTVTLWILAPMIEKWSGGKIDYLSISFVAIACSCLFFLPGIEVITWERAQKSVNWGGLILVVSGLSLGMAIYKSGAAKWIAWMAFNSVGLLHPALIVFAVVFGVSLMKVMFSSNTVTGIIVVPLLIALARTLGLNPALLAIPAGITSSLAFILVTSTPTNVIPHSSGYFSIGDMAKAGLWMTIVSSLCVTASIYVIGSLRGII